MVWCVCGGHKCPCGKDLQPEGGNCTHVLSEVLFQAGLMTHRNSSWMAKCDIYSKNDAKRPVNAMEMLEWFKDNLSEVQTPKGNF